ncbi:hypothetical protein N9995_00200, partial [bacterium]|nr:hypothetical protein [bacterium]
AEPSPSTSPEKPRAVDGAACVTAGTGGKDISKKDKLKDKYKEALVEEEKRKAEAAIMAANPAAKKGVQGMSAALGISEAVVEEDEDEDVDGEEGDKDEPEIVVGDEDEEEEAGAGRPRGEDDEKAKKAREQEEKDRKMFQQAEQAWERMEEKELVDMSEEYQQMQDKKIVSAQSGERQNTRIEAAECIITFEEAWTFFKRLNREAVRANIVEHAAPVGCFAALREKLLGRPELSSEALKGERELVFCCGQVGFGQGEYDGSSLIPNALHLKMLQTVYAHLMGPPYLGKPRYGSHWEAIGFQGSDPATDLRDLGMFSVLQMVYLVSPPQLRKVRQIFRFASEHEEVFGAAGRGFPFTLSCISLSRVCLEVLRAGSLVGLINKAESVMSVLNKLTLGMLCAFYALWREKSFSVTSGDFQQALEHTKARALKSPGAVIRAGEQPLWQPQMGAGSGMGGDGEFVDFSG